DVSQLERQLLPSDERTRQKLIESREQEVSSATFFKAHADSIMDEGGSPVGVLLPPQILTVSGVVDILFSSSDPTLGVRAADSSNDFYSRRKQQPSPAFRAD
ncbi:unnamed protein product, partial [Amoebophrya sp. A25]